MKVLLIHADELSFEAKKKAIDSAEEIDNLKDSLKECLVVFTAVEKADEPVLSGVVNNLVDEVVSLSEKLQTRNIVLYPYAHLSSDLASPDAAVKALRDAEQALKDKGFLVKRAPFGWYKAFTISCKGHPLSELSRSITAEKKEERKGFDHKYGLIEVPDNDLISVFSSFLLAKAIKEFFPKAEFGVIGYHQGKAFLDVNVPLKKELLEQLEKRVMALAKKHLPLVPADPSVVEGFYQEELLKDLSSQARVYSFEGLPLVVPLVASLPDNSQALKAFKILEVASAYWRNNANNEQLTRVYFKGFNSRDELKAFINALEEAERRDHRRLGQQLNLFSIHPEAPGMPFFHDNGTYIYRQLERLMIEEMTALGYEFNKTPMILNKNLWLRSGHWDHYKENMYFTKIDGKDYAVKPMNCPGNILIFKNRVYSYRDLPVKAGEFGLVHRHELSGVLSGLFRVRVFTQDDAHIFCSQEQIQEQIEELLDLIERIYSRFGFDYSIELSTKPEKAMGDPKLWELAEESLANALKAKNKPFKINPGDGAFYGPKIDFHVKDAIGRSWQCGTIQLDFQMPEKFDLTYEGPDGKKHRPVMLHRAIYGSFERFIGILIEHFAGKFPLWLNPNAVRIVTVNDSCKDFAYEIRKRIIDAGITRVRVDDRTETIGKKVRDAQLDKVNYVITIGEKEVSEKVLAVRDREGKVEFGVNPDDFINRLKKEYEERIIN